MESNRNTNLTLVVALLSIASILIISNLLSNAKAVQESERIELSVEGSRPIAKAVEQLEERCGCVITYEDAQYHHPSEISDVTLEVRRDLDRFPEGKAPRVFIPKPDALAIEYDRAIADRPGGIAKVVQELLDAHASRGNAGRFRLAINEQTLHVIPMASKNDNGDLTPQVSVFDAEITLPKSERTGWETLQAICSAVAETTKTRVVVGQVPLNLFLHSKHLQAVNSGKARDVLISLLKSIQGSQKLSWQLFYDPGDRTFALNVHPVGER